ncbi:MAG: right-handed parallel beta-helix repeat-containing protein [Bacteroidetes bacterium]|nr:right-handed parallel beta-helix repeat-containing protein [Bacteroidota bacterium]
MHSKNSVIFIIAILILLALTWSCRKTEKVDSSPSIVLSFSTDTIMFDTVLASVGSVTKRLLVYNHNNNKVVVSQIQLSGGSVSMYRINVDGIPGFNFQNIEIAGKDSIFVFVKVTINPNDKNTPFIVSDSLIFTTNGNRQQVQLAACGQNADFNIEKTLKGNQVWDSLKAHVIYGFLRVDTGASLAIMPGTKVYLHKKAYLAVSHEATLSINGQWEHPVRIQSDRLDPYYRDLTGQWEGIYLERGSRNNSLNNAIIKNGNYGLILDSLVPGSAPKLTMDGTIILNMVYDGIYAYSTSIVSTNCIIGNCGGAALRIEKGGSYDFRQLTVGNYWTAAVRNIPSVLLSNFTYDTLGHKIPNDLIKAYFGNAIVYGSETDEIRLDSVSTASFAYMFDHALLRTSLKVTNPSHYIGCMTNNDPLFLDVQNYDYEIDSTSQANHLGVPMGVIYDIRGILRPDTPSLGAYEYFKKP